MVRYLHGYSDNSRKASRYLNFVPSNRKTMGFSPLSPSTEMANWGFKHASIKRRILRYQFRERLPENRESRLDIARWRSTLVVHRQAAAMLIHTGRVTVNGKLVYRRSYDLSPGDIVSLVADHSVSVPTTSTSSQPLVGVSRGGGTPVVSIASKDPLPLHREVDLATSSFVYLSDPSVLPQHPTTATIA